MLLTNLQSMVRKILIQFQNHFSRYHCAFEMDVIHWEHFLGFDLLSDKEYVLMLLNRLFHCQ
ncbi:MAG: hypothetical protein VR69_03375 [Peptococcaceae bacterium BRH_c4b]|nr:MAG: hypothetical protein VR69_03375 [Peptococcaceae bacterium BRH_c4b]